MINRDNWKAIQLYLQYRREVDMISSSSQRLEKTWLIHLLKWSDEKSFIHVSKIRPSFPNYLLQKNYSQIYTSHVIRSAYRFFQWLLKHQGGYSSITSAWLDTLKVPGMLIEHGEHEAVTIEEIKAISSAPVQNIIERRIRASAVFWWLSGIRIGAFVSLPVSVVDLNALSIKQFPRLGVRTKFKKHATTYLFDIPDLLGVVRSWDEEVRAAGSFFWFASVSPETGFIDNKISEAGIHRSARARKDLSSWLARVDLPYHSPHKFRHGHAVHAIKHAKDISALKAISQNLMHSNLSITDGVYGILSADDVKAQIKKLSG